MTEEPLTLLEVPSSDEAGTVPWADILREATRRLTAAGIDGPDREARWLLASAVGCGGAELTVHLGEPATRLGVITLEGRLLRRERGEPLQYVLGEWSFRTVDLLVDSRVLIPRPETEVVVEVALDELERLRTRTGRKRLRVLDLGTGSGAIALSIAAERPWVDVWATDVSRDALAVARANLAGIGTAGTRVSLREGSWFEAIADEESFDLVISNPPYIAADEQVVVEVADWEPPVALVAGPRGTEHLEHLVVSAPTHLRRPGVLVLELAPIQAEPLRASAENLGYEACIINDQYGCARALIARLS